MQSKPNQKNIISANSFLIPSPYPFPPFPFFLPSPFSPLSLPFPPSFPLFSLPFPYISLPSAFSPPFLPFPLHLPLNTFEIPSLPFSHPLSYLFPLPIPSAPHSPSTLRQTLYNNCSCPFVSHFNPPFLPKFNEI